MINLLYCPTGDMTADILTKGLPRGPHKRQAVGMGLVSRRPGTRMGSLARWSVVSIAGTHWVLEQAKEKKAWHK